MFLTKRIIANYHQNPSLSNICLKAFNPIALRTAKTLWSFGHSECNRVKIQLVNSQYLKGQSSTQTTDIWM